MPSVFQGIPADGPRAGGSGGDPENVFGALDKFVPEAGESATPYVTPHPDKPQPVTPQPATPSPQSAEPVLENRIPAALLPTSGRIPANVESADDLSEDHPEPGPRKRLVRGAIVVLSVIVVIQTFFLIRMRNSPPPPASAPSTGMVLVQSTPSGAAVFVNGQVRGVTPTTLTLNVGEHHIEVASEGVAQTLPVSVQRDTLITRHISLGAAAAHGGLEITSQPSGQRVSIDGIARGVTPLIVSDIPPGAHVVVVDGPSGRLGQNVTVQSGVRSAVAVTMPAVPASGGWLSVIAPIEVQLYENGSLLGSSQTERIMLPAGRHVIEAVNVDLGYKSSNAVQIAPGNVASLRVEIPPATLDINALPWAEVTIGGKLLGTTPIGNVSVPLGTHEVIFRHPQLGERKVSTKVTAKGPNRVSMDMTRR